MAKHTQLEYGMLLKEQFEKLGMRVGLRMEAGERGWEGDLVLARGTVCCEGSHECTTELHSEVYIYIDDDGLIRINYSEPIIVDAEKKAKYDEWQAEEKRREEDMKLHPEKYLVFEGDEDYTKDGFEEDAAEVRQPTEDLVHMSEKQELELLRALNEIYLRITLYNRKNETYLGYHGRYFMDACSRGSAKKAAIYICDELYVACGEIEHLSRKQGFVRVKPTKPWESWADTKIVADIVDDFSQIDDYLDAKRREREKAALIREINQNEQLIDWLIEKLGSNPSEEEKRFIDGIREQTVQKREELAGLEEE